MSELVKEIEGRIKACETLGYEGLVYTLQRAREALSWIPVDRLPERDGYYLVTYKNLAPAEICDYEVKHGFNCTSYNPVIAWKQCPHAYTPEES